jgi:ribosomal protein L37E
VTDEQQSITCPECGMTSYHPMDIKMGYCGKCHKFTSAVLIRPEHFTGEEKEGSAMPGE